MLQPGYVSLLFFVIGVVLLAAEAFVPGGILGIIGAGLMGGAIAGLLFPVNYWVSFSLGFALVAIICGLALMLIYSKWRVPKAQNVMLASSLAGKEGEAVEDIDSASLTGKVMVGGEIWSAKSDTPISKGATVVIESVDGASLKVRPK